MRTILIVGLAAAGIGLAGSSGASAAPVNGTVIGDLATATDHVMPVQWGGHWRGGRRGLGGGPLRGGSRGVWGRQCRGGGPGGEGPRGTAGPRARGRPRQTACGGVYVRAHAGSV